jgi:hypothetical protein
MVLSNQWTYTLSNSTINITQNFAFTVISILATTGTTTVLCSLQSNGIPPTPITLSEGQSLTIGSGDSSSNLLDGITITTAGVTSLIAR